MGGHCLMRKLRDQKVTIKAIPQLKNLHSKSNENDAMFDDLLDDDSCIQHRRRANTNEAKFIDSDMFSDDTMGYGSNWLRRGELSNEQDAISDDSLGVGSLQLRGKTPKGKYRKYITEEDVISDDQREVYFWKQRGKICKGRQRLRVS
ncbi:hypothetical protein DEO72_LG3g268 [Vigna unguiculata]|uniref:Uncharacterized protein n=1 Tax=Vigna unguiculata TaxID=3917 RepID=A0A4D6LB23_VIGUN|nr:hypothetical protein DEO72_LG3g268 [Vigna unguiculata]